jgi:hypothetical protein
MKTKVFLSFSLFLFCMISSGQDNIKNIEKKLLFGKWISDDDKQYSLSITSGEIIEYYGKEKTGLLSYKILGNLLTQTDKKEGTIFNYLIREIKPDHFTLIYLEKGNALKFTRKK